MKNVEKIRIGFLAVLAGAALPLSQGYAQEHGGPRGGEHEGRGRMEARQVEPHPGPHGYARVAEPQGWDHRPERVDRDAYQHNYQVQRSFQVGPYHPPRNWHYRHWGYGEFLPRWFWGPQYYLSDYWLFGLEVPPVGFEWVRYGPDALLISLSNGQVLQAAYGVFH